MNTEMNKPTTLHRNCPSEGATRTQSSKLLTFRQVHELVGSTCKTGAYARQLAARGLIRVVRLNERTLRYTESSVLALVRGEVNA